MNKVVALLLVALCVAAASAQSLQGVYRQCDKDTGAETILEIFDDDNYETEMVYRFGGCFGTDEYDVQASFRINFQGSRSDGGFNVEYEYDTDSLVAIPYNEDAEEALENTCPGLNFEENQATNVASCLFCGNGNRFDILRETSDGFVLGDGFACSSNDRPTEYEESEFFFVESVQESSVSFASASSGSSSSSSSASTVVASFAVLAFAAAVAF
mmetsp:Transcript_15671/g.61216  ORF Transcript_15671/g.61216 Transcript_15671/m.61216 type:complete len:214 (-) Transcript_15671:45-686(-)